MDDYDNLLKIGLTKTCADCYRLLYIQGPTTAGSLSQTMRKSRSATYEAINKLEAWGFVERLQHVFPEVNRFRAVRLDKALENLAIYQRQAVRSIVEAQVEQSIRANIRNRTAGRDWR